MKNEFGEHDVAFRAMGCSIRLLAAGPDPDAVDHSLARVRDLIEAFDRELSRFRSDSELSRVNAFGAETVSTTPLMATLADAAVWAARSSNGLVDPTLVGDLESVGYSDSREGATPAPLADALQAAPEARPARPARTARWESISVDPARSTITRPAGVRIDSGGVGKGLAADAAASLLDGTSRFCVSAGGDLRIGGPDALDRPYPVQVEDPFGGDPICTVLVRGGGLATSGIGSRIWQRPDGSFAHHLIDPSTGSPAWTGLIQVTALAPTALEAETLSKRVLLGGPAAIKLLELHGGVVVHDDCRVEMIGPLAWSVRRPSAAGLAEAA